MTSFNVAIKKWVKIIMVIFVLLTLNWFGMNLSTVFGGYIIDCNNIGDVINDKYHNCIRMAGMILPIVYSVSFYYISTIDEPYIIVRCGKKLYEKKEKNKILLYTFIFASIYIFVDVIFMMLFVENSVLVASSYYTFILLKYLMLIFYLNLIGMTLFFLRNVMKFSGMYVAFGTIIYVFWTALYYILMVQSSPAFYMSFSVDWFYSHRFDALSYIINIAKLFFASLIFWYLGQIVFLKRDIIENEEI